MKDGTVSALTAAAEALDAELGRFEALAAGIQRERLDTEKNLRRAAQALAELHDSETRLGTHLHALAVAIGDVQRRQQEQAQAVRARGEEIQQRSERLAGLLARWQILGEDAREINRLVQAAGADSPDGLQARLTETEKRLGRLAEDAEGLLDAARTDGFPDLARQAESLRQQLLSARNKFRLMRDASES